MKRLLLALLLIPHLALGAYTEFYVQSTGNNLNAGSTTANTAVYTGVGDSDGTSVFTPSDGSTPASSVSVGDWASVYVTAGASVATFVGRVTAVGAGVNGTITVSTVAKAGTFPAASSGAHTITCKTGGAWAGPSGTVGFPFGFAVGVMTNASGDPFRCNIKGAGTVAAETPDYSVSTGMTQSAADNVTSLVFQGYTNAPGDLGMAIIDGGVSGTAYNLLAVTGKDTTFADLVFQHHGASSGSTVGLVNETGTENTFLRCVFRHARGYGLILASGPATAISCEAYDCNQVNVAGVSGISLQSSGCSAFDCISHHNNTANSRGVGFEIDGGVHLLNCLSISNDIGVRSTGDVQQFLIGCGFYQNNGDAIALQQGGIDPLNVLIINCNFVKNGGWGINFGGAYNSGLIANNGFGSGTMANTSGTINTAMGKGIIVTGSITFASGVTPWVAPNTGDFRINLAAAKNAGYGHYTQVWTNQTWAGTIGYPDIGAAQHLDAGGTGGQKSYAAAP